MGTYRFFLAFCVLYSHAFGAVLGKNIGVAAVISFFIMSGYVMALLLKKYYPSLKDTPAFLSDRALRIFPHYLFYILSVLIFATFFAIESDYATDFSWWRILANLVILPLNLWTLFKHSIYNPPTWSLALELTFYLAFPLIWAIGRKGQALVFGASVIMAGVAFTGAIDSDYWGYRLLPGTLLFFLAGAAMATPDKVDARYPLVVLGLAVAGLIATLSSNYLYHLPYDFEVSAGAIIGIGAIYWLRRMPFMQFDKVAGDLSYGLFLSHYPTIFVADTLHIDRWPFVPVVALAAAAFSYLAVERTALRYRHAMRSTKLKALRPAHSRVANNGAITSPHHSM
ncbi:acyltransferase [Mesorhizobium sp.]|uniref:acyltransferase family protein n=1 Tax=Mesorhizobium sp. TaxID=1871066 RepID=UPI000FE67947|nr:acyltransferase [Mesorhizobium sp.]RWM26884.1 MAG: acyltransferase [Mesorhizobium sp.]